MPCAGRFGRGKGMVRRLSAHGDLVDDKPWIGTVRQWQPLAASAVEPVAADES